MKELVLWSFLGQSRQIAQERIFLLMQYTQKKIHTRLIPNDTACWARFLSGCGRNVACDRSEGTQRHACFMFFSVRRKHTTLRLRPTGLFYIIELLRFPNEQACVSHSVRYHLFGVTLGFLKNNISHWSPLSCYHVLASVTKTTTSVSEKAHACLSVACLLLQGQCELYKM